MHLRRSAIVGAGSCWRGMRKRMLPWCVARSAPGHKSSNAVVQIHHAIETIDLVAFQVLSMYIFVRLSQNLVFTIYEVVRMLATGKSAKYQCNNYKIVTSPTCYFCHFACRNFSKLMLKSLISMTYSVLRWRFCRAMCRYVPYLCEFSASRCSVSISESALIDDAMIIWPISNFLPILESVKNSVSKINFEIEFSFCY